MALGSEVSVLGLNAVIAKFKQLEQNLPAAVAAGLYEAASNIMDKSLSLVPVDTGALRSTGHVELPKIDGGHVSVEMGYGGPAGRNGQAVGAGRAPIRKDGTPGKPRTAPSSVGYATHVHERTDVNHPVGQAKFLEVPLVEGLPNVVTTVAAVLNREIESLGHS